MTLPHDAQITEKRGAEGKKQTEDPSKVKNASLMFNIMTSFIGSNMNKAGNSRSRSPLRAEVPRQQ